MGSLSHTILWKCIATISCIITAVGPYILVKLYKAKWLQKLVSCSRVSLIPRPFFEEEEEKESGTHCMHMHQIYRYHVVGCDRV